MFPCLSHKQRVGASCACFRGQHPIYNRWLNYFDIIFRSAYGDFTAKDVKINKKMKHGMAMVMKKLYLDFLNQRGPRMDPTLYKSLNDDESSREKKPKVTDSKLKNCLVKPSNRPDGMTVHFAPVGFLCRTFDTRSLK